MARRRRGRRHRRGGFKIPVVTLAILGGQAFLANEGGGTMLQKLGRFGSFYTGFEAGGGGTPIGFNAPLLLVGWGPWLAKGLVSKIARPLGARPRVPFGLPISIS